MSQTERVAPSTTDQTPERDHSTDAEPSNGRADLSRDEIFEILSNKRRRLTIHYLHQNGERADLGTLAEHIAAKENDVPIDSVSYNERKCVYTSLQQFHLPKLDDRGVVDFDRSEGVVELDSIAEDIDVYLEVVEGRDIPWSHYYLVLAIVNLAVLAAAYVGAGSLPAVPWADWGIFVAVTFLVSAIAHTYVSSTGI
jgi:DNA-binding transcriptional ArsR family regulator